MRRRLGVMWVRKITTVRPCKWYSDPWRPGRRIITAQATIPTIRISGVPESPSASTVFSAALAAGSPAGGKAGGKRLSTLFRNSARGFHGLWNARMRMRRRSINGTARALTFPALRYDSVKNLAPGRKSLRTYSTTAITGAVLTTLLLGFSAFARDHSALNGTWTLVPAKSDFAGQPVVQTGTVTISDRQGIIIVSRSFVYEGATETFFYSDITDSENNATIRTGKNLKSKTRWDHDVLKVTTTQSGAITLESYTLAADGTMMVSVVRPDHKPITLIFQHK